MLYVGKKYEIAVQVRPYDVFHCQPGPVQVRKGIQDHTRPGLPLSTLSACAFGSATARCAAAHHLVLAAQDVAQDLAAEF